MKQAANKVKEELSETRQQLSNKQKDCSTLEVQVQDLKKESDEVRRRCAKYSQEVRLCTLMSCIQSSIDISAFYLICTCVVVDLAELRRCFVVKSD